MKKLMQRLRCLAIPLLLLFIDFPPTANCQTVLPTSHRLEMDDIAPSLTAVYSCEDIVVKEYLLPNRGDSISILTHDGTPLADYNVFSSLAEITEGDKTVPIFLQWNFGNNEQLILYKSAYTNKVIGYEWYHEHFKWKNQYYSATDNVKFIKLKIEGGKDSTNRAKRARQ